MTFMGVSAWPSSPVRCAAVTLSGFQSISREHNVISARRCSGVGRHCEPKFWRTCAPCSRNSSSCGMTLRSWPGLRADSLANKSSKAGQLQSVRATS